MRIFNWITLLFSLVWLLSVDTVEASFSVALIRSFSTQRFLHNYFQIFTNYMRNDLLKILPIPQSLLTYFDTTVKETALVSIIKNNEGLLLGDALLHGNGEIYFFLAPTKGEKQLATLLRASTGIIEPSHKITEYILISRFDNESVWYLDYSNYPEINDQFKVIHHYRNYLLLWSTRHSIVFVAPDVKTEEFLCGEYKTKMDARREREDRKHSLEKKKILKSMGIDRIESILPSMEKSPSIHSQVQIRSKAPPEEFLVSPDSVAYSAHLMESSESHIANLFGKIDGTSHIRALFIYERLVPLLLENKVSVEDAMILVRTAEKIFHRERIIERIRVKNNETITVVGDIHGQYFDLLRIFKHRGWPDEKRKYLFNGDIVDRGRESIECLLLLYALKITFPKSVFINRGNHETEMCGPGSFSVDSYEFDPSGNFYRLCQNGFYALPLAHVINDRIYVVHGGIRNDFLVNQVEELSRFQPNNFVKSFMISSMWDEASEEPGVRHNSSRGSSSFYFGPDVTESFLIANGFDYIIRSHTYVSKGIEVSQGGKCWTLFSAPNYGGLGNTAVVITYDSNLVPEFGHFRPTKLTEFFEY